MKDQHIDTITAMTAPPVYGVAALTVLGFTLQDWIVMGSAALLVMNLGFSFYRIYKHWRGPDG